MHQKDEVYPWSLKLISGKVEIYAINKTHSSASFKHSDVLAIISATCRIQWYYMQPTLHYYTESVKSCDILNLPFFVVVVLTFTYFLREQCLITVIIIAMADTFDTYSLSHQYLISQHDLPFLWWEIGTCLGTESCDIYVSELPELSLCFLTLMVLWQWKWSKTLSSIQVNIILIQFDIRYRYCIQKQKNAVLAEKEESDTDFVDKLSLC
jgi:hypothetical protein